MNNIQHPEHLYDAIKEKVKEVCEQLFTSRKDKLIKELSEERDLWRKSHLKCVVHLGERQSDIDTLEKKLKLEVWNANYWKKNAISLEDKIARMETGFTEGVDIDIQVFYVLLSRRVVKLLKGILEEETIENLVLNHTELDLLWEKGFGKKALIEVRYALNLLGLKLRKGM